ncbi:hypothetical protein [Simonsiella muelleri]|uniref:hypothetical protein n=1 Tax=Simonsiella muelleri TaxID=72 RepID=UPI0023EFAB42|nr:hypothetical protein [Simonsiella muelleri]
MSQHSLYDSKRGCSHPRVLFFAVNPLSGSLKNVFDQDRVQSELDLQRTVSQSFNQNVQAANTEINQHLDQLKAQLKKAR